MIYLLLLIVCDICFFGIFTCCMLWLVGLIAWFVGLVDCLWGFV